MIDSGSCENIISSALVKLLSLPIEIHPDPYINSWIKDVHPINVVERSLVSLSIDKYYTNCVMYDIVDKMHAMCYLGGHVNMTGR